MRENGWDVSVLQKLHGGHATELAQEAVRAGCQVVVDCGGDGTLNEVVEGVLGTETAVGVLPGGTANLWAREVGVASRLQVAAAQLVSAERRRVDVGQVAINGRHKSHFVLMAGVGFDGAVIERVNKPLKNRIGTAAVGLAALRALPAAQAVPVRMELDDLHWQGLMGYNDGGIRVIGAHPRAERLLYNLGCNGVGFLPSICGGERVSRILAGERLPPSIFDPR